MDDYSSSKNKIVFDYKNEEIRINEGHENEEIDTNSSKENIYAYYGCFNNTYKNIARFTSDKLSNVKYFEFNLKEAKLKVIAIEQGIYGWSFFIDNWQDYLKILSYIQNPDKEVSV